MGNLRPVLIMGLVFLGYLMWVEWQKDYGPAPRPGAAQDISTQESVPDVPGLDAAAPAVDDLPAQTDSGPAPVDQGAALSEPAKTAGSLESGIGALLGDESILDLETEIGQIRDRSTEIDYTSLRKAKNIHFFDDGLDYDEYLKGFRGGKTETDRLRSLVELSGKLKAVNAAIFSKDNGKYSLVLRVGLNDPGFEVYFTPEEPFVEMFVKPRHTVYIGETVEKIKALSKKMHPEDLKYMQAALVFPVVFRTRESFLILGLPVRWDLDIEDIITRLDIY